MASRASSGSPSGGDRTGGVLNGTNRDRDVEIRVAPRSARRALLATVVILTVASAVAHVMKLPLDTPHAGGLVPLFDSDAEANLPTWYSSLTLLACSLMIGAIALSVRRARQRHVGHWTALSIVFFVAALDEAVGLHEVGNEWLSRAFDPGGVLFAIWVVPGLIFVLVLAIAYRPFVADLPDRVQRLATRGALVFVGGALGLEVVEGAITDSEGVSESFADGLVSVVQEFLEMLGVIFFIEALMTYMATSGPSVTIGFGRTLGTAHERRE